MSDGPRRRPRPSASSRPATGRGASRSSASRRAPAPKGRARRPDPEAARSRRMVAGLVVSVALVGFLLIAVFPTRTWLAQRSETADAEARLERIRSEQAAHEERIDELETPGAVEHIAREDYGMVRPGEAPFQMLPPAAPPVDLPDAWPFAGADDWLNR